MSVEKPSHLGSSTGNSNNASEAANSRSKRLPAFITENVEPIVGEWEIFARTLVPSSTGMTSLALRDHIHQILEFIVHDISSPQTPKEQTLKSKGEKQQVLKSTAAETHAALRLAGGFNIEQMVSEYRALRASIIKLWSRTGLPMDSEDLGNLTRFNESIDQALAESVSYYTKQVLQSKDLFVGILSHDLRSPVQAITLSTELLLHLGTLTERQTMLANSTIESADRITKLIENLLDVTRARFGSGLPIIRSSMDMGFVGHQIVDELRVVHPSRAIDLDISGNMKGEWDKARVGQVFSNLLGNAIQYGFKETPISVAIKGSLDAVELTVHNIGVPIPADKLSAAFDPFTRATSNPESQPVAGNLGLGLFIAQEVVQAHGGTIHVTSSEENGTTFSAIFPRRKAAPILRVAGTVS